MTLKLYKTITIAQHDAALSMLKGCIQKCPDALWQSPVGTRPFWIVVYHTLCYADLYCAASNRAWKPDERPDGLHPLGKREMQSATPSQCFSKAEMLGYVEICREKAKRAIASETAKSLAGPSGFSWMPSTRAELHTYNTRHVQHHTGQLGAFLRREGISVKWIMRGS